MPWSATSTAAEESVGGCGSKWTLRGHDEGQPAEQRRAGDGRPRGLGGRRHALAHDGFDRRGCLRLLLLESAKLRAEEDEHLRFRARGDCRRPSTAVEHCDLAEEVADR